MLLNDPLYFCTNNGLPLSLDFLPFWLYIQKKRMDLMWDVLSSVKSWNQQSIFRKEHVLCGIINVRPLCYDYSADIKEKNMDFCECRYKL